MSNALLFKAKKQKNSADNIDETSWVAKLLLATIFILPFSVAISPAPNVDLNIVKLAIPGLFLIWLLFSLANKKILLDQRGRFWFLIAFSWLFFFSALNNQGSPGAMRKALFFFSVLPIYFVLYALQNQRSFLPKFITVLKTSATLLALIGLSQFFSQFILGLNNVLHFLQTVVSVFLGKSLANLVLHFPSWLVNISGQIILRAFFPFPDPHLFSLYLNLVWPFILFSYFQHRRLTNLISLAIILLAIIFSFSRSAYLALLIGWFFWWFFFSEKKKYLILFLSLVTIINFLVFPNPVADRFLSSFNAQEGSNAGRILMWQTAGKIIREYPWSGIGLANFSQYVNAYFGWRNPIYAHNLFLDIAAELGIPGLFFFLAFLTAPVFAYFKKRKKLTREQSQLFLAQATALVIFIIQSCFETPLFSVRVLPLLLIIVALDPRKYYLTVKYYGQNGQDRQNDKQRKNQKTIQPKSSKLLFLCYQLPSVVKRFFHNCSLRKKFVSPVTHRLTGLLIFLRKNKLNNILLIWLTAATFLPGYLVRWEIRPGISFNLTELFALTGILIIVQQLRRFSLSSLKTVIKNDWQNNKLLITGIIMVISGFMFGEINGILHLGWSTNAWGKMIDLILLPISLGYFWRLFLLTSFRQPKKLSSRTTFCPSNSSVPRFLPLPTSLSDIFRNNYFILPLSWLIYYLVGIIWALIGFYNFYQNNLTFDHRLTTFFESPNQLAFFLMPPFIFFSLVFFKYFRRKHFQRLLLFLPPVILLGFNLFFTFSAGALLALGGLFLVCLFLFFFPFLKQRFKVLFLSGIIIFFSSALFIHRSWLPIFYQQESAGPPTSFDSRLVIYQVAKKIILDNFPQGIGAGFFQEQYLIYQKFFPPYPQWAVPHAHNILAHFLVEGGLLAAGGLILIIAAIFLNCLPLQQTIQRFFSRQIRKTDRAKPLNNRLLVVRIYPAVLGAAQLALIYIIFHGLVDNPLWFPPLAFFFWVTVLNINLFINSLLFNQRD